jgi:hypothetical protein
MSDKQLRIGTLTFSSKSKVQQAIATYLNGDRLLIMQALIDRFGFLALAETDVSENELRRALIETNTALTRAIEINHQIAAQHGITLVNDGDTTSSKSPMNKKTTSPDRERAMNDLF